MREQIAQHSPLKRRATADQYAAIQRMQTDQDTDESEVPDAYYPQRMPSSARRYVDTRGNQVIQQGNRRIVIHEERPPKQKVHWMLILGIGMVFMLMLYVGFNWASNWWTEHQLDGTYGFPRTYQTDAIVYPGDTSDHPSHYIFLNLNGTVEIIELPHGDSAHARIYKGPTLFSDHASLIPVTGEFKVVNSKVEMIAHIQDQRIIYINDGTQFKPQQ
jgi:hypothetical protein